MPVFTGTVRCGACFALPSEQPPMNAKMRNRTMNADLPPNDPYFISLLLTFFFLTSSACILTSPCLHVGIDMRHRDPPSDTNPPSPCSHRLLDACLRYLVIGQGAGIVRLGRDVRGECIGNLNRASHACCVSAVCKVHVLLGLIGRELGRCDAGLGRLQVQVRLSNVEHDLLS